MFGHSNRIIKIVFRFSVHSLFLSTLALDQLNYCTVVLFEVKNVVAFLFESSFNSKFVVKCRLDGIVMNLDCFECKVVFFIWIWFIHFVNSVDLMKIIFKEFIELSFYQILIFDLQGKGVYFLLCNFDHLNNIYLLIKFWIFLSISKRKIACCPYVALDVPFP